MQQLQWTDERVELLKKLWNDSELYGNEKLLPTTNTYNIVMKALSASEGALAAENLLLDLGDKYKQEKVIPFPKSYANRSRSKWLRKSEMHQISIMG